MRPALRGARGAGDGFKFALANMYNEILPLLLLLIVLLMPHAVLRVIRHARELGPRYPAGQH
jgi:hypothetical protein